MPVTTSRYINLFTDFGFKKIFGEEPNKDLLIDFLNEVLGERERIADLTYLKSERLGRHDRERKAVYDLYCINERGERFIVEVQRVKQQFFKDRSVYYASFAIQEQATQGKNWQYELKGVYTIALLDFTFDDRQRDKYEHRVKLMDVATREVFYPKLTFIYIEIPKFEKELAELRTNYEKWLYAFKNLHRLREMPSELEAGVFTRLFELAEIARLEDKDRDVYEESLKDYWDMTGAINTAKAEAKTEVAVSIAKKALREGLPLDLIQRLTGLSAEEIEALKEE
jgi:predicted transposase/invertase (TIGR01784 family)